MKTFAMALVALCASGAWASETESEVVEAPVGYEVVSETSSTPTRCGISHPDGARKLAEDLKNRLVWRYNQNSFHSTLRISVSFEHILKGCLEKDSVKYEVEVLTPPGVQLAGKNKKLVGAPTWRMAIAASYYNPRNSQQKQSYTITLAIRAMMPNPTIGESTYVRIDKRSDTNTDWLSRHHVPLVIHER